MPDAVMLTPLFNLAETKPLDCVLLGLEFPHFQYTEHNTQLCIHRCSILHLLHDPVYLLPRLGGIVQ